MDLLRTKKTAPAGLGAVLMGPFREIRMKKTALDGLNWMIQPPCLLMRLRDYFKIKDKIRTKIRTKKTAPAGRTTRRMDFNPETLSNIKIEQIYSFMYSRIYPSDY